MPSTAERVFREHHSKTTIPNMSLTFLPGASDLDKHNETPHRSARGCPPCSPGLPLATAPR